MSDLKPRAFDIETSGLEPGSVITVAGIDTEEGSWMALNTGGRHADGIRLTSKLESAAGSDVRIDVCEDETSLLQALDAFTRERIDGDQHYLTAYNGETWNNGFDLPFLRRACVRCNVEWPFPSVAYADTMEMMDRFDTDGENGLVSVYDELIGNDDCDPFDDSSSAVAAFNNGDWINLLLHNLADIQRTRELAVLAGRYVAKSDFNMKNLSPPDA